MTMLIQLHHLTWADGMDPLAKGTTKHTASGEDF